MQTELPSSLVRKETSCRTTALVLKYFQIEMPQLYPAFTEELSGYGLPLEYYSGESNWISFDLANSIYELAYRLTGDPYIMYRIGMSMDRIFPNSLPVIIFRTFRSPRFAFSQVSRFSYLFERVSRLHVLDIGSNHVVLEEEFSLFRQTWHSFQYAHGIYAKIPEFLGMELASAESLECAFPIYEVPPVLGESFTLRDNFVYNSRGERVAGKSEPFRYNGTLYNSKNDVHRIVWRKKPRSFFQPNKNERYYEDMIRKLETDNRELEEKTRFINELFTNIMDLLMNFISHSSSRVYDHTQNVTRIATMLARKLALQDEEIENIRVASLLHDIGMIGVTEEYFHAGRTLAEHEEKLLRMHPQKGVDMLRFLDGMEIIKTIILQHHEKWDGSGYPEGLSGDEILPGAQVISIADDVVWMLSARGFQTDNKKDRIVHVLKQEKGKKYKPELVERMVDLIQKEDIIYMVDESDIRFEERDGWKVWEFPSNTHFEPIIVGRLMDTIRSGTALDDDSAFSLDYSMAEVIRNGIVHGNHYNESKHVRVALRLEPASGSKKLIRLMVTDEGEGMDIQEHNRFSECRNRLNTIVRSMSEFGERNTFPEREKEAWKTALADLEGFREDYYTDFNVFRQIEGSEISGGVGLLYVKKTFDDVVFRNIVDNGRITGLEVTLTKLV
jgi:putative nucleotidyltransferase with HDIG domain